MGLEAVKEWKQKQIESETEADSSQLADSTRGGEILTKEEEITEEEAIWVRVKACSDRNKLMDREGKEAKWLQTQTKWEGDAGSNKDALT